MCRGWFCWNIFSVVGIVGLCCWWFFCWCCRCWWCWIVRFCCCFFVGRLLIVVGFCCLFFSCIFLLVLDWLLCWCGCCWMFCVVLVLVGFLDRCLDSLGLLCSWRWSFLGFDRCCWISWCMLCYVYLVCWWCVIVRFVVVIGWLSSVRWWLVDLCLLCFCCCCWRWCVLCWVCWIVGMWWWWILGWGRCVFCGGIMLFRWDVSILLLFF